MPVDRAVTLLGGMVTNKARVAKILRRPSPWGRKVAPWGRKIDHDFQFRGEEYGTPSALQTRTQAPLFAELRYLAGWRKGSIIQSFDCNVPPPFHLLNKVNQ